MTLSPYEYPVDRVIREFNDTKLNPRLPVDEIVGLHNSGLSTDEDGDTITDVMDEEIPHGFSLVDDTFFFGD